MPSFPAVKIVDVDCEVGYSDPANFTRAFNRGTGVSPRECRGSNEEEGNSAE